MHASLKYRVGETLILVGVTKLMDNNMSPNKGGRVLRLEPEGIELLEACPKIM